MNRPGLQLMFKDMEKGLVNTIIVKDLSRFSRNYIEAGQYLEQVFPSRNIRFISVGDNYDSINGEEDFLVFRNYFNTLYSKDIQKKIHRLFKDRVDKKYLVSTPIYGYIKDKDKNIIIDEDAAKIVRYIFDSYIEGKTILQIARSLENQKVYNASAHKHYDLRMKISPLFLKRIEENPYHWDTTVVKRMLQNYEYCGHAKNLTWSKNPKTSKETNIIVRDTHPAIISEETFNKIPKSLDKNSKERIHQNYFPRMIKCATHKNSLIYRRISGNIGYVYRCDECKGTSKYIKINDLIELLYQDSMNLIQEIILDKDKVLKHLTARFKVDNDYSKLQATLDKENNKVKVLFENMITNKISKEDYNANLQIHKQNINEITKQLEEIRYHKIDLEFLKENYESFITNLNIEDIFNLYKIQLIKKIIKNVFIDFSNKPLKITIKYIFDN